ncbi:hypothetical protein ABH940_003571 [Streptacidiphilus sp. BW17]|uniref:hypothetical protein n=1 Tax=Streptacidiphilus sp. BW17 TaxID=3156274 RepID=UPI003519D4F8
MSGVFDMRRIPLDPGPVVPGSTLEPIARYTAQRHNADGASVVLGRAEVFEREQPEYVLARLSWGEGRLDAAQAVRTEALSCAPAGASVYFPVSAAVSKDHSDRRALAVACGLELFQEKEGFLWADTGQPLPESRDSPRDRCRWSGGSPLSP